jgi:hypothetical protein
MEREIMKKIATGFDLEPLADGTVLIEFYGDDGETCNTQVVTADVVESMPLVASLTGVALREGPDALKAIITRISECQEKEVTDEH